MPESYLITGGAGNLACQLTFELAGAGNSITLFDVASGPAAAVARGSRYVRGDMTRGDDIAAVLESSRPTTVLHFASLLSGSCEADRGLAWRVNMDGAFALFEAALRAGVRTVFFPSSLATYGGTPPGALAEDFPQWPAGLYGVTKVACERLGVYYAERHGLDFRCLRLPVVISRYAPAGAASAYASRAFVEAVAAGQFTFKVRPDTRTAAVYVRDVLGGIVGLLAAPAGKLTRRVYNIAGLSVTPAEVADAITRRLPGVRFRFDPDPPVADLVAGWPAAVDDAAARRDWGWQPRFDLDRLADDFLADLRRPEGPP
jgi:threonine 3-dehydrogenase